MQIAQRGGSIHSSTQGTMAFRGASAEDVTHQLDTFQSKYAVKVVALSVIFDPTTPKPKDGSFVLIVTLAED